MAGGVLRTEVQEGFAERDPAPFATPAAVDQAAAQRQQPPDDFDGPWRGGGPTGLEAKVPDADLESIHRTPSLSVRRGGAGYSGRGMDDDGALISTHALDTERG